MDPDRLQDREYLMSVVAKVCPQFQMEDLQLFTMDNLRSLLFDTLKKQPSPSLSAKQKQTGRPVSSSTHLPPINSQFPPLRSVGSIGSIGSSSSYSSSVSGISSPSLLDQNTLSNDVLKLLEQICNCLDKDSDLQDKIRSLKDRLIESQRSKSYSSSESHMIQKDLHGHLFDSVLRAYQTRHKDLAELMSKKVLQPETEKMLCENQQILYQLLCQYQKMTL